VTGEHTRAQDTLDLASLAAEHGFQLRVGTVEAVDAKTKTARRLGRRHLGPIFLVLALGAGRSPIPGVEHTHTIWGEPEDTLAIHDVLDGAH